MSIDYFVSYRFPDGFGRCYITRDNPITCIDDVYEMEQAILKLKQKTDKDWDMNVHPVIVNWQRFEKPF